jgi:hypothetical protein
VTRAQERRLKRILRRATVPALLVSLHRLPSESTAEEVMDRLWQDKAALGELLRREFFSVTPQQ